MRFCSSVSQSFQEISMILSICRHSSSTLRLISFSGIEARGFIFGPPIALAIGAKFVPLRKPKKLPGGTLLRSLIFILRSSCIVIHFCSHAGEVISENYDLEYGSDCLQMHVGAVQPGERVLVVDDLVATGGTLRAAISLLGTCSSVTGRLMAVLLNLKPVRVSSSSSERVGGEVVECACVIELPELKVRSSSPRMRPSHQWISLNGRLGLLQGRERLNGKPLYILVESH